VMYFLSFGSVFLSILADFTLLDQEVNRMRIQCESERLPEIVDCMDVNKCIQKNSDEKYPNSYLQWYHTKINGIY
jgi:hypothetical protein